MRNWAMDSGYTPHLLLDTTVEGLNLPFDSIQVDNDMVLLNIHDRAVSEFQITDEWIMFAARFSRRRHQIDIPFGAVISAIVPETGDKVLFRNINVEVKHDREPVKRPENPPSRQSKKSPQGRGRPHLTLVE